MKLRLGDGEFGEIYHAACAYELNGSVTMEFRNFPNGQDFFDTFIVDSTRDDEKAANDKLSHLGETAIVIRDSFHVGCMGRVTEAITKVAKVNSWALPAAFAKLMTNGPKVLLWHRSKEYKAHRNSTASLIRQLADLCESHNTMPVFIGPALPNCPCYELGQFWTDEFFNDHSIAKQLWCIDKLFNDGGVLGSLGVMSGAMDGPAMFFGHKTVSLASHRDATPRMQRIAASVPNLIWQQIEFSGVLATLNESDLAAVERQIWC